jgi:hypothetical protein
VELVRNQLTATDVVLNRVAISLSWTIGGALVTIPAVGIGQQELSPGVLLNPLRIRDKQSEALRTMAHLK